MKYDAMWWKTAIANSVERMNKDMNEVPRVHELSNAAGKWTNIVKLQVDALRLGGKKPSSANMPDLNV